MTSKLTGEGDDEEEAAVPKKALEFSAINSDFCVLSKDTKTKVVQHVSTINISI